MRLLATLILFCPVIVIAQGLTCAQNCIAADKKCASDEKMCAERLEKCETGCFSGKVTKVERDVPVRERADASFSGVWPRLVTGDNCRGDGHQLSVKSEGNKPVAVLVCHRIFQFTGDGTTTTRKFDKYLLRPKDTKDVGCTRGADGSAHEFVVAWSDIDPGDGFTPAALDSGANKALVRATYAPRQMSVLINAHSHKTVNVSIEMKGGETYMYEMKPHDVVPLGTAGRILSATYAYPYAGASLPCSFFGDGRE